MFMKMMNNNTKMKRFPDSGSCVAILLDVVVVIVIVVVFGPTVVL